MKFIMMSGIAGSGKSTVAGLLQTNNTVLLSSDSLRKELWGSEDDQQKPEVVFREMHDRTIAGLKEGKDIIYDATNLNSGRRRALIQELLAKFPGLKTELHIVAATPEQCIANQQTRDRKVPDYVIRKQILAFQGPALDEPWTEPIYVHNAFYRNGMLQDMVKATVGVSQLGPWHQETVDRHIAMVVQYAKDHHFSQLVQEAAAIHDIGKPYARTVDDNGNTHFYGHAQAGAYLYLCTLPEGCLDTHTRNLLNLVEHHMDLTSDMNIYKLKAKVGDDMYNELRDLHEADENGAVRLDELGTMSILKFMNAFPDWEDRIQKPPYCITVKHDGDLVLLQYQQLNSDMKIKLVQECRGSIFRCDNGEWKYVCRPFDKFFNYGEGNAAKIDWSTARILEKVDGCFHEGTLVTLADGTRVSMKRLASLVTTQDVDVLTMNLVTHQLEPKRVLSVNVQHDGLSAHWVQLQFNDIYVNCTTNHVFYVYRDGKFVEKDALKLNRDDVVCMYRKDELVFCHLTQIMGLYPYADKYDIEVEDNHNYFANGVLVHNSLMKVYCDGKEWRLATNGTIDAFKAPVSDLGYSYGDVFNRALGYDYRQLVNLLDSRYTYMFELTSPDTQLVIPYEDGVWYLSRRDTQSGKEEFDRPSLPNVKLPRQYKMDRFEDVIEAASKMSKDEEGFVVNDANSCRVKVKSPEYLIAAHLSNNKMVSNRNIIMYMQSGTLDDFLAYCPQYTARVNGILDTFNAKCRALDEGWERISKLASTPKELAAIAKKDPQAPYYFLKMRNPDATASQYLLEQRTPSLMRILGLKDRKEDHDIGDDAPDVDEER